MSTNKSYTIHKSKKSLSDKALDAGENLKRSIDELEHRNEWIADFKDISFVNDARSCDILSTRDTFKCILKPIVWLSANTPHDRDFALIEKYLKFKVKSIVVYAHPAEAMKNKIGHLVEEFKFEYKIEDALKTAFDLADSGDCILFSPGCLPEDGYASYVERGNAFRQAITLCMEL